MSVDRNAPEPRTSNDSIAPDFHQLSESTVEMSWEDLNELENLHCQMVMCTFMRMISVLVKLMILILFLN